MESIKKKSLSFIIALMSMLFFTHIIQSVTIEEVDEKENSQPQATTASKQEAAASANGSIPLDAGEATKEEKKQKKAESLQAELINNVPKLRDTLYDLFKDISFKTLIEQAKSLNELIQKIHKQGHVEEKKWINGQMQKLQKKYDGMLNMIYQTSSMPAVQEQITKKLNDIKKDLATKKKRGPALDIPAFEPVNLPENLQSLDIIVTPFVSAAAIQEEMKKAENDKNDKEAKTKP